MIGKVVRERFGIITACVAREVHVTFRDNEFHIIEECDRSCEAVIDLPESALEVARAITTSGNIKQALEEFNRERLSLFTKQGA